MPKATPITIAAIASMGLAMGHELPRDLTDQELADLHLMYAIEERLSGFQAKKIQGRLVVGVALFGSKSLLRKARKMVASLDFEGGFDG